MRRGVVPNPNSEPLVGRGQLTSVWLGGLANPAALVTLLKHEKAAMVGCRVDGVKLYLFFFFFFFFFKAIESIIQLNIVTMGVIRVGIVTRKSSTIITIEMFYESCMEV